MYRIRGCPKCDRSLIEDEGLWCKDCRKERPEEYKELYEKWFAENREVLLRKMGVPPLFQDRSFDNFKTETAIQRHTLGVVKAWTVREERGLFLCGPPGTGKTHLAVSVLANLRKRRFLGKFVSTRELLLRCRNSFRKGENGPGEILTQCTDASPLLLDDLGAENPTEFSRETMETIIDRVYRDRGLLIVTSNFSLDGLSTRLGNRIADRLMEICVLVKFSGETYRKSIAMNRASARAPIPEVIQ